MCIRYLSRLGLVLALLTQVTASGVAQRTAKHMSPSVGGGIVSVTNFKACQLSISGYKFIAGPFIISSVQNLLVSTVRGVTATLSGSILGLHNADGVLLGEVDLFIVLRDRFDRAQATGVFELEHEPIVFDWVGSRRLAIVFTELFARRREPAPHILQLATSHFCIFFD
jgi:hypothetical protein